MKKFISAILFSSFLISAQAAETKRICHDSVNPQTKRVTQVCKEVKQHKKLEGTKVPEKKSK